MNFFSRNSAQSWPTQTLQTINAHTLKQYLDQQSVVLVDVREVGEYAAGHIAGATLVPLSSFDPQKILGGQNQTVVLYCRSGQRSAMAAQRLLNAGFNNLAHLEHGISAWVRAGYPVQVG